MNPTHTNKHGPRTGDGSLFPWNNTLHIDRLRWPTHSQVVRTKHQCSTRNGSGASRTITAATSDRGAAL